MLHLLTVHNKRQKVLLQNISAWHCPFNIYLY